MFVLFSEEQADCCSARAPVCLNQNNQNECLLASVFVLLLFFLTVSLLNYIITDLG